ncbi:MAG: AtpZ/AtpI family protein [Candidatus Glassbacteria bacterium]
MRKKTGKSRGRGYEELRALGAYSGLGIQLVLITLVFFYAGWRLDHYIFVSYKPVFTLILTFLGGAAAFYRMYRFLFHPKGNGKKESGS